MQLLPHGMQELLRMTLQGFCHQAENRPQRKTAAEQLIDQRKLLPMRLAQVRAGNPASQRLEYWVKSILVRSRNARRLPQS